MSDIPPYNHSKPIGRPRFPPRLLSASPTTDENFPEDPHATITPNRIECSNSSQLTRCVPIPKHPLIHPSASPLLPTHQKKKTKKKKQNITPCPDPPQTQPVSRPQAPTRIPSPVPPPTSSPASWRTLSRRDPATVVVKRRRKRRSSGCGPRLGRPGWRSRLHAWIP